MSQQHAGSPAPLLPAVKCDECRIGIARDFYGNGLTGREKRNHVQLFMPCKVTPHLCKACFESIRDAETVSGWKQAVVRGIPFYLLVPRGLKESAQKLAGEAAVPVSGIYEYTFVNDLCQVL